MAPDRGEKGMFRRWIYALLKWVLAGCAIGGLIFAAYWVSGEMRAERLLEGDEDKIQSPHRLNQGVVELGADAAERYGLKDTPARAVAWSLELPIYGQVVPNSAAAAGVRSPFAGTLRSTPHAAWPEPGRLLRAGDPVGWIDLRLAPQERLNLRDNLNSARLRKEGAEKIVALQRERVKRIQKVSESQIVPGQQLDDARVLLADAETQLAIATAAVDLWKEALADMARPGGPEATTYSRPLAAPADGTVVELTARPGMEVEAGAVVMQLVDFRRPLVRMDLPRATLGAGPPARLRVFPISAEPPAPGGVLETQPPASTSAPLEVFLVGPSPRVDDASQFAGYWYTAVLDPAQAASEYRGASLGDADTHAGWRPGLRVKANMTPPEARPQPAVAVPVGAVLFHQGRSLVYVRVRPGAYERREVKILGRQGDSWVLTPRESSGLVGLSVDEVVASEGGQVLLSEEFRGDMESD